MSHAASEDFHPLEVVIAIVIGGAVTVGALVGGFAAFLLALHTEAVAPEVDKGAQEPVKVTPVIDEEYVAKLGGGKKAVLPDMWNRAPASVKKKVQETPPPPEVAAPSENASLEPDAIPDASKKVATVDDASVEEIDAGEVGADAGLTDATEDAGIATLDPDGGAGPEGVGDPTGKPDGGLDKFQEAQYLGRLIAFFKRGFVVNGLGLPPEEIKKLAVSATCNLDSSGTVLGCSMGSSGNATFDAAAKAALDSKKGQQVPPPPEDRPDLARTSLSFTMTCSAACN